MIPIAKSTPTTADVMPPPMYHNVFSVRRPRKNVLALFSKDRESAIPTMIKIAPPIRRTAPTIRAFRILIEYPSYGS
jgi:hypothetical protein